MAERWLLIYLPTHPIATPYPRSLRLLHHRTLRIRTGPIHLLLLLGPLAFPSCSISQQYPYGALPNSPTFPLSYTFPPSPSLHFPSIPSSNRPAANPFLRPNSRCHHRQVDQLVRNDVSSTKVRMFLRKGMSVQYLIPGEFFENGRSEHRVLESEVARRKREKE